MSGWRDASEFTIWRCPKCGTRGWTMEPNGHVPSSHVNGQGMPCVAMVDRMRVPVAPEKETRA